MHPLSEWSCSPYLWQILLVNVPLFSFIMITFSDVCIVCPRVDVYSFFTLQFLDSLMFCNVPRVLCRPVTLKAAS